MQITEYLDSLNMRLGRRARVGFIGVGVSNLALLDKLSGHGYDITIRQARAADLTQRGRYTREIYGDGYLSGIDEDVLFLSPSVRRDSPELIAAKNRGIIFSSDMELFFESGPTVYAVTGSDGKSTTATLASMLLSDGGGAMAVGNIGVPFTCGEGERFVAELSSFQLLYHSYPVRAAAITSLSENHLDWHKSLEEYYGAKLSLLDRAEWRVVSADSPVLSDYLLSHEVDVAYSVRLGYNELSRMAAAKHYITLSDPARDGESVKGHLLIDGECEISVSDIRRREWYNVSNAMGAMGLCYGEYSREHLYSVLRDFPGLSDRCESLGVINGVEYVNSSIDTTPARTAATLTALGRKVSLIVGGRGKGLPISPAMEPIIKYAKRITLYGDAGKAMFSDLLPLGIPIEYKEAFDDAFNLAEEMSEPGDTVLLSPMATGYGEFKSYRERAERFCYLVGKVAEKYKKTK